jgi:hypothetical protein
MTQVSDKEDTIAMRKSRVLIAIQPLRRMAMALHVSRRFMINL